MHRRFDTIPRFWHKIPRPGDDGSKVFVLRYHVHAYAVLFILVVALAGDFERAQSRSCVDEFGSLRLCFLATINNDSFCFARLPIDGHTVVVEDLD
jgi:hypothetical protein